MAYLDDFKKLTVHVNRDALNLRNHCIDTKLSWNDLVVILNLEIEGNTLRRSLDRVHLRHRSLKAQKKGAYEQEPYKS